MQINCVLFADKIEYIYIAKKKKKKRVWLYVQTLDLSVKIRQQKGVAVHRENTLWC